MSNDAATNASPIEVEPISSKLLSQSSNGESSELVSSTEPQVVERRRQTSWDILLPNSLSAVNALSECTLLVQIDPQDSATLDFEGTTGAIGRLETVETGVVLDLKGSQYHGRILSGPTAMLASLHVEGEKSSTSQQYLKIDAITNEFCPLVKTCGDVMAQMDGFTQGDVEESTGVQKGENDKPAVVTSKGTTTASSNKKAAKRTSTGKKRTSSAPTVPTASVPKSKKRKINK